MAEQPIKVVADFSAALATARRARSFHQDRIRELNETIRALEVCIAENTIPAEKKKDAGPVDTLRAGMRAVEAIENDEAAA